MIVVACGIVPAPYRVDLFETAWTVGTVGPDTAPVDATIEFNEGGVDSVATVATPCGRTQLSWEGDSDGDLIEFWDQHRLEAHECSDEALRFEARILEALNAVQTWEVKDDDHITLIGDLELALQRKPE